MSHRFASTALVAGVLALAATAAQAGGNCRGSQCYQLVKSPPTFETVSEKVVVRPERKIARHIPAEYGHVTEHVVVRPARVVTRHIPAEFGVVAEKVLLSPARKEWQVRLDAHGRKVGCWVDVPAQFGVQHRRVVVREAQAVHETIPEVVEQRSRRVLVRPAKVAYDVIPAEYGVRHHHVMTHPGSKHWAPVRSY
jgi:hypothetical protein